MRPRSRRTWKDEQMRGWTLFILLGLVSWAVVLALLWRWVGQN